MSASASSMVIRSPILVPGHVQRVPNAGANNSGLPHLPDPDFTGLCWSEGDFEPGIRTAKALMESKRYLGFAFLVRARYVASLAVSK
jgi:hypothetical protein